MERVTKLAVAISLTVCLSTSVFAQSRGNGRGPSISGAKAHGHGPATTHGRAQPKAPKTATFTQRIEQNPQLNARLTAMLPPGTDMQTAASGFKNQGQFIAALHVSRNLGLSFDELKLRMTGEDPKSLGAAIQELKPELSEAEVKKEAEKAEKQAKATEKEKTTEN